MNKTTYTIKPLYLGEMTRYEKSMHTFTFDYGVKMHSPYLAFLVVLDGDEEIIPGIEVFLTPGHTPGSQCVRVNTEDGYYLIAGDTVNIYENWEGNAKYHHVPAGIHVDLR